MAIDVQPSPRRVPAASLTMDHDEAGRWLLRLGLMSGGMIEIRDPTRPAIRMIGFIIEPDEHYKNGDGIKMLAALQHLAEIDIKSLRDALKVMVAEPWEMPAKPEA